MKTNDIEPWFCHECKYGPMDAVTSVPDDADLKVGSILICLNCGAVFELDWQLRPRSSKFLNPLIIQAQEAIRKRGRFK